MHYKYTIYTRQMDFKLNTGSCCMGKKGCSKIQNNKLNTYDWLCDVPDAANATDYVEVQFKNTRKGYYLNSSKIPLDCDTDRQARPSPDEKEQCPHWRRQ